MAKINIITNLYNSKKYISKLIKSIALQSYTDWHLYCIDDCSPKLDNLVIEKWSYKLGIEDKVTIHRNKENLGIAKAKEVGIKLVCNNEPDSSYVTFIDGDDWLGLDALENFYLAVKEGPVDVVISNYNRTYNVGPFCKKNFIKNGIPTKENNITFQSPQTTQKFLKNYLGEPIFHWAYWAKIYRIGFLSKLDFEFPDKEHSASEDFFFSLAVMLQCRSVKFISPATYNWRWGGISTNHKNSDWTYWKAALPFLDSYLYRSDLIHKYHCIEEKQLNLQIINLIFEAWSSKASSNPNLSKSIKLKEEIKQQSVHPTIKELQKSNITEISSNPLVNKFISALLKNDINEIYNNCYQNWKGNFRPHNLRTFIRWLSFNGWF